MEVKLKQIVGEVAGKHGTTVVKQPIDHVYVDGRHVGYLPHQDAAIFSAVVPMSKQQRDPIVRKLVELRESEGVFTGPIGSGSVAGADRVREAMEEIDRGDEFDD